MWGGSPIAIGWPSQSTTHCVSVQPSTVFRRGNSPKKSIFSVLHHKIFDKLCPKQAQNYILCFRLPAMLRFPVIFEVFKGEKRCKAARCFSAIWAVLGLFLESKNISKWWGPLDWIKVLFEKSIPSIGRSKFMDSVDRHELQLQLKRWIFVVISKGWFGAVIFWFCFAARIPNPCCW